MSAPLHRSQAQPRPSWATRLWASTLVKLELAVELLACTASLAGIPVALIVGKLFLAVILAVVALGVVLRISGRRKSGARAVPAKPAPIWHFLMAGLLSIVEVALLVEATGLPVRYDQPQFTQLNWLLVILALGLVFGLQRLALRRIFPGRARAADADANRALTPIDSQK